MPDKYRWPLITIVSAALTFLFIYFLFQNSSTPFIKVITHLLVAVGGGVAIIGNTWESKENWFNKLTITGLIAFCMMGGGFEINALT